MPEECGSRVDEGSACVRDNAKDVVVSVIDESSGVGVMVAPVRNHHSESGVSKLTSCCLS